jgi:ABC-type transport system involved in multi-copper enzyme maturation permease subunit
MPVYRRSYRSYDGAPRRWFRYAIITEHELRILAKTRIFRLLILAALIHGVLRLLQVIAYDVVMQDPNNLLTPVLQQVQGIMVNEQMFFDFIRLQASLVFLIGLYAGSGMICNDFNNNLMEVYFSKPLRWWDYAAGKVLAIVAAGLLITAAPGILLVIAHNLLAPGRELFFASMGWIPSILAFSLVVVLPVALCIPACSALVRSRNLAAIFIIMLLIVNSTLAGVLVGVLQNRNWLILSFPAAINRTGQHFFHDRQLLFDLPWHWALGYTALVCAAGALILAIRIRRAEAAA